MKILFILALAASATGAFAMAQNSSSSFPPNELATNTPTASTNRTMSLPEGDWRAMPPPGVSFMTGGVGRVTAPIPATTPAVVPAASPAPAVTR